jgi:hypothetical protein
MLAHWPDEQLLCWLQESSGEGMATFGAISWKFLREIVYSISSRSLEELKDGTEQTVANIHLKTFCKFGRNAVGWADVDFEDVADI